MMTNPRSAAFAVSLLCAAASAAHAQTMTTQLDSTMRVAERAGFSGVVRIERDGATLLEKGYGLANRGKRIPFTAETVVQIGSNTKDFTAVAILQLQEAGKLSQSDSLAKYFPSAPADKRNITIAQLMNHRAGFPAGIGGDFEALKRSAFIDRAMKTPLLFPPGSRESYSNTGFSVLAAIIEQVTGTTYDAYVQRAILAPLGLRRTGFLLPGFKADDLAHGYLAAGSDQGTMLAKPHDTDGPYWNLRGNGGMLSTVADMHAFYKELFEGTKLMTPATRALRFNPDQPIGLAGSDGVNFFLYERFPRMKTEVIIASTNVVSKAPAIRRELGKVLGLPNPDGEGGGQVARRPGGKPAPDEIAALLRNFVAVGNSGDTTRLRTFISAHFAVDPDSPTLNERVTRFSTIHETVGAMTIDRIEQFPDGSVEMTVSSQLQGTVLMRVVADAQMPYLIHGIQVRIGG
jgi:CubicO group peptidase (beta-lactamase class C family)